MTDTTEQGISVRLDVYGRQDGVFRYEAADEVLRLLVEAHDSEFTIRELAEATDSARSTIWRAVELLDDAGVVRVRETPQRNYVSIDPDRLRKDDPVLAIEQSQFHDPIRAFVDELERRTIESDDVEELLGVVVFGSVARGEADRRSDVDLFVLVAGDRTSARSLASAVADDVERRRFDGDRFAVEPQVETRESARRAGSKLRELLAEGVTVYGGDRITALRRSVFSDE